MPNLKNKYDIPTQVEDWDELLSKYTQSEIVGMCDSYLRGRVRGKFTRAGQKTELEQFREAKKAGWRPNGQSS